MINIRTIEFFDKSYKHLFKKYRSISQDYLQLIEALRENPYLGTDLGNNIHKIRIGITGKGKGKRGGARVLTDTEAVINVEEGIVTLLAIYDKAEISTLSDNKIKELVEIAEQKTNKNTSSISLLTPARHPSERG